MGDAFECEDFRFERKADSPSVLQAFVFYKRCQWTRCRSQPFGGLRFCAYSGKAEGFPRRAHCRKYSTITGACSGTITRDLADLVVNGALLREGERRHARYPLCSPLRPAQHVTSNDGGAMAEEQQCGLIRRRVGVECTPLGSSSRPTNLIASTD